MVSTGGLELVTTKHKAVITRRDSSVIKGYLCNDEPCRLAELVNGTPLDLHEHLHLKFQTQDGTPLDLPWSDVKAVFFVADFQGNPERDPVLFYTRGPEVGDIWAEVMFHDGEVMEGYVGNDLHHLTANGFFLRPTDPGGNNLLVYVNKSSLKGYRVLGVLTTEK
jgi:hypothetical protein